jgi:thioredoxin 1
MDAGRKLLLMQALQTPTRADVDATREPLVLEFGAAWCGICRSTEPLIARVAQQYPSVRHIKIEDGPGQVLGRSFGVKLWPTFVFVREGEEVARLVRPRQEEEITAAFQLLLADVGSAGAYPGKPRGFGGGRYAAPYSGSYGGEFRGDYRGTLSEDSDRFPSNG